MSRKTLNIAMIGHAFMGRAHSNAWRQIKPFFDAPYDVCLHTICGRDEKKLAAAADKLGWKHHSSDWKSVVANPEIDIVDINTSNDVHAEMAIFAAQHKKAILCEKPLARNAQEAKQMLDAVKEAGVIHMVCHNYRRIPAIELAKNFIEQGKIGRVYHFHARYAQDWLVDPSFPRLWRMQASEAGSGANGDINAHIIDLARYLVGEPKELCAHMETFIKERPLPEDSSKMGKVSVDDAVNVLGRFENGAMLNLEATRFAHGRRNRIAIEINGEMGSLYFNFEKMNELEFFSKKDAAGEQGFRKIAVTESIHPYAGNWWPVGHTLGYEHTFVHSCYEFLKAIEAGKSPHPSFEDGYRNQLVVDAVGRSASERKWVEL